MLDSEWTSASLADLVDQYKTPQQPNEVVGVLAGRVASVIESKLKNKGNELNEITKLQLTAQKAHKAAEIAFKSLGFIHKLLAFFGYKTGKYKAALAKKKQSQNDVKVSSEKYDSLKKEYDSLEKDLKKIQRDVSLIKKDAVVTKTVSLALPIVPSSTSVSSIRIEAAIPTLTRDKQEEPLPVSPSLPRPIQVEEQETASIAQQHELDPNELDPNELDSKEVLPRELESISGSAIFAEGMFGLMHLGSAYVDISGSSSNVVCTLIFTISILEEMLKEKLIPVDEIKETEKLLNLYRSGLEIAMEYALIDASGSKEEVIERKNRIETSILSRLHKKEEILIPTGYNASPSGHAIGLQLSVVDIGGIPHVQGEVINRGAGLLEYHGKPLVHGLKMQYASILTLAPVPLSTLEKSPFLSCLTELSVQRGSFRTSPSTGDEFSESTQYHISDFYEIALGEWPGSIQQAGKKQEARGVQRGLTCAMKMCLTPMRQTLSATTAHHIKLRMLIKSLQLLLANVPLEQCHVSHLEWSIGKLNRSLEKLIKKGIATESEQAMCRVLSLNVREKIELVKKEIASKKGDFQAFTTDLVNSTDYSVTIQPIPELVGKEDTSIDSLVCPKGEAFSNIDRAVSLIKKIGKLDACSPFYGVGYRNTGGAAETVSRLALEYLESLPLASDASWLSAPELTSEHMYYLHKICTQLVETSRTCQRLKASDGAYTSLSGRQIAALINTYAGILQRLQASISPELLGQQVATILALLQDAGPQIRFKHPTDLEKFLQAQAILRQLNPDLFPPRKSELSGETTEFKSYHDIQKDPMTDHVYQSLVKGGGMDKISHVFDHVANHERFQDLVRATVCVVARMYTSGISWLDVTKAKQDPTLSAQSDLCLDLTLMTLTLPLTLGIGARFNFDSTHVDYHAYYGAGIPTLKTEIRGAERPCSGSSSIGILSHHYFPWRREDSELIGLLLDRRSDPRSRAHENTQLLISQNRFFRLEGQTIPAEEMEMLLSITTYDATLVPQCIRYFQRYFFRLKNPRFQSLLEAFLCTRADNGKPVLANVMMDPDNSVAEQLIKFLEDGIKTARVSRLLETELALTRILAQICVFSQEAPHESL